MAHHVHRAMGLGAWVLINENWNYTPASRELSEQFDQNDGAPNSARNLSWSYACFITAYAARRRAALQS